MKVRLALQNPWPGHSVIKVWEGEEEDVTITEKRNRSLFFLLGNAKPTEEDFIFS